MTNHHDAIVTAGVDFAFQASNTAACSITWTSAGAVVTELTSSCDDNFILELVSRVTKVGIDVPLGWPSPFVEALRMHAHDGSWPANYEHVNNLKDYRLRSTDNWVHETLKLPLPLSVATDRIAIPTMRAAALFALITPRPPLDGSGRVIEVYPAAALARWGFTSKGYKGKANVERRAALIEDVANATSGWLQFTAEQRATCVENDNVLDALIATLVSRAALTGLTESIPLALRDAATREGWIAIPRDGSLSMLAGPSQGS
jgi:predicted nuclease with RNAse H fold